SIRIIPLSQGLEQTLVAISIVKPLGVLAQLIYKFVNHVHAACSHSSSPMWRLEVLIHRMVFELEHKSSDPSTVCAGTGGLRRGDPWRGSLFPAQTALRVLRDPFINRPRCAPSRKE